MLLLSTEAGPARCTFDINTARLLADEIGFAANSAERYGQQGLPQPGRNCLTCEHAEEPDSHPNCSACLLGPLRGFPAWEPVARLGRHRAVVLAGACGRGCA